MFDPLRIEVMARLEAAESFFKAAYGLGGDKELTAKGLVFVQMYAAYEYTVVSVVQAAVDAITKHGHRNKKMAPSLLALFLDRELRSFRTCGEKSQWEARLTLLKKVFSKDIANVPNDTLPKDGSHFRSSQLQLIFDVLGIKRLPAHSRRHLQRINDVVENRNEIAHGRDTAENVGRRYTEADVLLSIKQIKSVCLLLIQTVQNHCADGQRHCR